MQPRFQRHPVPSPVLNYTDPSTPPPYPSHVNVDRWGGGGVGGMTEPQTKATAFRSVHRSRRPAICATKRYRQSLGGKTSSTQLGFDGTRFRCDPTMGFGTVFLTYNDGCDKYTLRRVLYRCTRSKPKNYTVYGYST